MSPSDYYASIGLPFPEPRTERERRINRVWAEVVYDILSKRRDFTPRSCLDFGGRLEPRG